MPIRASAVESDSPMQKVNRDVVIMIGGTLTGQILLYLILIEAGSLTEICKSSNYGNEDSDDSEFPPVYEIRPNYWKKKQQANQDLSKEHISKAVDEPVLDKGGQFIISEKSLSGLNLEDSQSMCTKCSCHRLSANQFTDSPILIEKDGQNETSSKADLSDPYIGNTKSTIVCLNSQQTSFDTTISSSSVFRSYDIDCKGSRAAKLGEIKVHMTKTICVKRVRCPLKRKTMNTYKQILSKFPIV
jgi:hypothetical protein